MRRVTGQAAGEGFPNVAQQHHLLEILLEKGEELEEVPVVVAEAVRCVAGSQVKVRDDCDLHDVPSLTRSGVNLGPLDIGPVCRYRGVPERAEQLYTSYAQYNLLICTWCPLPVWQGSTLFYAEFAIRGLTS